MRKLAAVVVFVSSLAIAATPSVGVPLEVRRGFFTETDIGGFFTLGGQQGYSNLQVYLQLGIGYQLTVNNGKGLIPIGLHGGIGSNAQNCFAPGPQPGTCARANNFTLTMLNLTAGYLHEVVERFYVGGKLIGGTTLLDPDPIGDGGTVRANLGVAASLEYATNMDHFSIGLDIAYRFVVGPNISSMMIYPRVQYTF